MVTQQDDEKITYTTMSVNQAEAFNAAYSRAVHSIMGQLGREYPIYINGEPVHTGLGTFQSRSPGDTRVVLGQFQESGPGEADAAIRAAQEAFKSWASTPWQERVAILRKAATTFRAKKYEMGAWLSLEAGKPRLEAAGEVEEAADLIETYCGQMEENNGFIRKMGQLSRDEVNHSVMKPYGVWVVIAPFNFPIALATGMLAGALVTGNTTVFKPSQETPLCGIQVYECLVQAGLPAGVLNMVTGLGNEIGEALSSHRGVEGIAFTGSKAVGCNIYAQFSAERPRPCITEMGGKNPVIVTNHADLDRAVEGTARAAFGYSGQKCSAASRIYVQAGVADEFIRRLVDRTRDLTVGNPVQKDVFMGPVINEGAYRRFEEASRRCAQEGEILTGGQVLIEGEMRFGYYCEPTICRLPADHEFFARELFVPLVALTEVSSLQQALQLANESEYGLTAGIFTEDAREQREFLDTIEAGVIYVNRSGGATTGAWPGIQSFGGWKASGSPGVAALGPYYVQQFMREQNQTVVG